MWASPWQPLEVLREYAAKRNNATAQGCSTATEDHQESVLIYSSKDGELVVLLLSTANDIYSSNTWAVHTQLGTAHALDEVGWMCNSIRVSYSP